MNPGAWGKFLPEKWARLSAGDRLDSFAFLRVLAGTTCDGCLAAISP
jgi:hypothetical protein